MKKLTLSFLGLLMLFACNEEADILPEKANEPATSIYSSGDDTTGARTTDDPASEQRDDLCERDPLQCPADGGSGVAEPKDEMADDPKFPTKFENTDAGEVDPSRPVAVYEKIRPLFRAHRAGFVKDFNWSRLFPRAPLSSTGKFLIPEYNIYVVGSLSARPGATYLIIDSRRQRVYLGGNYLSSGNRMGLYVLNVIFSGGRRKAALFDAATGTVVGWYPSSISGTPTVDYDGYIKFLSALNLAKR